MGQFTNVSSKDLAKKVTPSAIKEMGKRLENANKLYDEGAIDKETRDKVRKDARTQLRNVEKANKATATATKTTIGRTKK